MRAAIPVSPPRMFFTEHKSDHYGSLLITLHGSPPPSGQKLNGLPCPLDLAPSTMQPHGTLEAPGVCYVPAHLCTAGLFHPPSQLATPSLSFHESAPPNLFCFGGKLGTLTVPTIQDYWEHPTKSVFLKVWSGILKVPNPFQGVCEVKTISIIFLRHYLTFLWTSVPWSFSWDYITWQWIWECKYLLLSQTLKKSIKT